MHAGPMTSIYWLFKEFVVLARTLNVLVKSWELRLSNMSEVSSSTTSEGSTSTLSSKNTRLNLDLRGMRRTKWRLIKKMEIHRIILEPPLQLPPNLKAQQHQIMDLQDPKVHL